MRGLDSALPAAVLEARGAVKRLALEQPELAGPAALLHDFLPVLFRAPVKDQPPVLEAELIRAKLSGGVPLLRGESPRLDMKSFEKRWAELCSLLDRHMPEHPGSRLAQALKSESLTATTLISEVLAGRPEAVFTQAAAHGLDPQLTATVLRLSLFPALAQINTALLPLREKSSWTHGYCPTCGSWPLLGEFRGLEQTRFLRCGLCAAQWESPRLSCPFCSERDHQHLGYLHVEGEENKHRAATCETCHGYVKIVSTLQALTAPHLLVMDLATSHLDLVAAERGYAVT
jgi:FdhE protein